MRSRSYDSLLQTLSSSTLRRPFRLFLPVYAAAVLIFILVRLGFYDATRAFAEDKTLLRNRDEYHQPRFDTLYKQATDFVFHMSNFIHVWCFDNEYGGGRGYDPHTWTIPVEFRASLALFLSHFAVARMKTPVRLAVVALLMYFALIWDRWEMILFWAGMLLAEVDQIRAARKSVRFASPDEMSLQKKAPTERLWSAFWIANLICGMYLASYPEAGGLNTPGFSFLASMVPVSIRTEHRWWQGWGAVQITWAICSDVDLQALFNTKLIQYLGKVSYAMYLMHGPVLHTFGYTIMPMWWSLTGTEPGWFELGFFLAACTNTCAIILAADLFWRFVDLPCVKFARWLETKCIHRT